MMTKIKVAQHIYGNVEEEFSPTRQGGFQTLFFTQALLSKAESAEVEDRLLYYQSEANPVKHVFFMLASGKAVVSRILPMTGKDKYGREGSYLTHSLIVSKEDFMKLENNPFNIFEMCGASLLDNLDKALKKGNAKTQDFEVLLLNIDAKRITATNMRYKELMQQWGTENLKKLALYTIDYQQMKAEKEPLVFAGSAEKIEEAIGMLFLFLPVAKRTGLSFDTHFTGCNLVYSDYWAIGFPKIAGTFAAMDTIDCNTGKLNLNMKRDMSPYKLWVLVNISRCTFTDLISYSTLAYELQELVLKQPCDQKLIRTALTEKGNTPLKGIIEVYNEAIKSRTTQEVKAMVGEALSGYLLPQLLRQAQLQLLAFLNGFDINRMADDLYKIFKRNVNESPSKQEIKGFEVLLKKVEHERLSRMLALWNEDYQQLIEYAVVIPQAGNKEAVTTHEATVEVLCSLFPKLKLKELLGIKKLADKHEKKLPELLEKALDKAILDVEKLIKPSTLKRFFSKVINKFKPGNKEDKE